MKKFTIIFILFQSWNQNLFMSEYWYDIKSDDADFDDEPVYANSEEVRQSIVEQQKYWLSLKFFIMKNQQIRQFIENQFSFEDTYDSFNSYLVMYYQSIRRMSCYQSLIFLKARSPLIRRKYAKESNCTLYCLLLFTNKSK